LNFGFNTTLPDAAMSYHASYVTTQPFWIKDMMTHVQADRMSEFSTSGSGDNVSVYWEPVSSFTDPFKTYSPTDTILPPPSSLENLPTLPLSPTGSPGAQLLERLLDTEALHEFESSVSTTIPSNEEKRSHTYCTCHRGALRKQSKTLKQITHDNIVGVCIGQAEEGKENKSMVSVCSVVHFCCTKRKVSKPKPVVYVVSYELELVVLPVLVSPARGRLKMLTPKMIPTGNILINLLQSAFAGRERVLNGRQSST